MKISISKEKIGCPCCRCLQGQPIFEICDQIQYLRESEKFRETIFAFSYGAKVESFKQKNGRKSLDTVPLRKLP